MLFQCREIKDLNRGRLFVSDIFHSRKIPHFKSLDQALEVIVQVLLTLVLKDWLMLNQIAHSAVDTTRSICASDECTVASIKSNPDETRYYTVITIQ